MNANIGGLDRILRAVVGLALIGAAVTGYLGAWAYIGTRAPRDGGRGLLPGLHSSSASIRARLGARHDHQRGLFGEAAPSIAGQQCRPA